MRRILVGAAILAAALALYAGAYFTLNGNAVVRTDDIEARRGIHSEPAGDTLEILVWNLGYGGLGRESDFVADGGTHTFPPSRRAVIDNVSGIDALIRAQAPDVDLFVFQEIAGGGPVNYWVNLRGQMDRTLASRHRIFFADFKTRLMPWPLAMTHGQAVYARAPIQNAEVVALPAEDTAIFGVKRRYASVVARLPIEGREQGWTIASVHLAAFDPDAAVRTRQLRQVLAWAEEEYARGQHVVLAGDWNLQLTETSFPHRTDEEFLFWLFPFPQDALPQGWRIGADAAVPSVRTNHQPYVAGDNYTTTIDGLIVSPNVSVEGLNNLDLGFAHADHQPIRARVRAN